MNNFVDYLRGKLEWGGFRMVRATGNKVVIFKCFSKYTKCIYVSVFDDYIEINIDKVFDSKFFSSGIERLITPTKIFEDIDDTLNYIQKNIAIWHFFNS